MEDQPPTVTDAKVQKLLEEEWNLFNDPVALKDGVVLMSENDMTTGKLITRLSELPESKTFLTPLGNRITRISPNEVQFADGRIVMFQDDVLNSANSSNSVKQADQGVLRPRSSSTSDPRIASSSQTTQATSRNHASFGNSRNTQKSDGQMKGEKGSIGALDLSSGPRGLLETIKSAVLHTANRRDSNASHRPPQLLPGEVELFVCHDIEYVVSDKVVHPGALFLTNYQVLFRSSDTKQTVREVSLAPLGKITRVEKVGGKKSSYLMQSLVRQLLIHCKDFHKDIVIRMADSNAGQRKQLFELINKRAFPGNVSKVFAFSYTPSWSHPSKPVANFVTLSKTLSSDCNLGINGWDLYSPESEAARLAVFERTVKGNPAWRWTDINKKYELCKSYPETFIVPYQITDAQLQKASQFRTQSRLPILSWVHKNGTSISRCSQPRSGLVTSRSAEDELLLSLIRETAENDQYPLVIIDPRPRTNAEANRAVGAGYEKESNYARIKVHFMGIGNIHVVRDSQQSLASLCASVNSRTDTTWYSGIESSGWLKHIKSILAATTLIVKCLHQHRANCLVHCSDGWDRTSQVVSLAMLCMDPFYRTISGFCILVEKEWIHAGHMFATRHGHASKNYSEDQRAPIFLQWMDCVWQIYRQFPTAFEFNENLMMRMIDEVCNCRFGTFLADNEAEMKELALDQNTVSLWTYVHHRDNFYRFVNSLYSPPIESSTLASKSATVLLPRSSIFALNFWSNYYLQSSNFKDRTLESAMERAFEFNCQIEDLQGRIAELERENAELRAATGGSKSSDYSTESEEPSQQKSSEVNPDANISPSKDAVSPQGRTESMEIVLDKLVRDLTAVGSSKHDMPLESSQDKAQVSQTDATHLEPMDSKGMENLKRPETADVITPRPIQASRASLVVPPPQNNSPVSNIDRSLEPTGLVESNLIVIDDEEFVDDEYEAPRVRGPAHLNANIIEDYSSSNQQPKSKRYLMEDE